MINLEFYRNDIERIGITRLAVDKVYKKPCICGSSINCKGCLFHTEPYICPNSTIINWLLAEHEEPKHEEPKVDWSTIPVDTKILVRDSKNGQWFPRYFAKYDEKTSKVFAWFGGGTSWSETCVSSWKFAKLAEEEMK